MELGPSFFDVGHRRSVRAYSGGLRRSRCQCRESTQHIASASPTRERTALYRVSDRLSWENRGPGLAEGRMTAIAACPTCGTEPLEDARFCHSCGSPVDDGDAHAEYKQVTVLFADVVHSMDIASAVGAERLREIMTDLANRCAAVVQRYAGTFDKFTGDGVMAVFGAPVALEDHAVRACLAALAVQEEAKRFAVEVEERDGVDLQLRVGLNSGEVIAGEIGSGAFGYTAVGEQVGMAQQMESVAPPGGVVLSTSTARLVERAATLDDAGRFYAGGPVGLAAELRAREKVMATTLDARQGLRIRYTEPASSPPAGVTNLDQYRDL